MSDPNNTLGWIWRDPYHKWPDYSPRHPVQSGLCPDAESIRELSSRDASTLVIEIRDLWRLLQEREDDSIKKRNKLYFEGQRKDERISALEAEAEALHAAAEGWRKRAEAAEASRSETRRQALEEAARLLEEMPRGTVRTETRIIVPTVNAHHAATAIRTLADKD